METATYASCTSVLLSGWIARSGNPELITSDRGTTFTSQLWTSLVNLLGLTLHQTTAYNCADDGMVERFYPTFKATLMSHCKDSNWFTRLPWVLLGLRTTPKDTLHVSEAEIVHGESLVVQAEFFPSATSSNHLQRIHHFVGKFTPCRQSYKPQAKHQIPTDLHSITHVFLRNDTTKPTLTSRYTGLFLVIRSGLKAFLLNIRGKEDWARHIVDPGSRLAPPAFHSHPTIIGTMADSTEVDTAPLKLSSFASPVAFAWFQHAEVQFRNKDVTR
ncbi:uncharacterized protein [Palaemon carinicauda]|uniref:uncharacterized protein n=1 Tax=Palaemon carinicauda TaxID=392227 RepID=UPI0035B69D69